MTKNFKNDTINRKFYEWSALLWLTEITMKRQKKLTISGSGEMEDYDGVDKDEPRSLYTVNIEKVIIESGVTNIGDNAFLNCGKLVSVIIPDSVTDIGYDAFANCDKLTIYCNKKSFAHTYAKMNKIKFKKIKF